MVLSGECRTYPAVWGRWTAGIVPFLWATLAVRLVTQLRGRRPGDLKHEQFDGRIPCGPLVRDDGAHGPCIGNVTASVLLVIGYPLALGVLTRLRPVLAERRVWWFVALEAATASITAGWLLHGRLLPAAINGAALAGFGMAWLVTGSASVRRRKQPADCHADGGDFSIDGAPDKVS